MLMLNGGARGSVSKSATGGDRTMLMLNITKCSNS